jgi:hypothetical protein
VLALPAEDAELLVQKCHIYARICEEQELCEYLACVVLLYLLYAHLNLVSA